MISLFFFFLLLFVVFFSFFSDGWCVTLRWGFSDCDPPLFSFNPKKKTKKPSHPTTLPNPQPPSSSRCSRTGKLRFTLVAVRLGSLVGNRLHLGRGVLHLRLAFGLIVLHSLPAAATNAGARKNHRRDKKRRERRSVNGEPLSLSLTAKLSALSWLLCHFSKKERGGKKKMGGKTCKMLWGNLFSLLELNAFHT